jgi:predicted DNA binding CopG/RHH family protein
MAKIVLQLPNHILEAAKRRAKRDGSDLHHLLNSIISLRLGEMAAAEEKDGR